MSRRQLGLLGSLLTGILLIVIFPPWNLAFLAPAALAPLLFALAHEPAGLRRFGLGWLAGLLYWLVVCHWIRDTLAAYGGLTGPLSWFALFLFAAIKAIHLGVFAWLAGMALNRWWAVPAVAALWTGIERTHGPFGFAWLALGNAGIDMGLPLRAAPVTGVYGISFAFAALATGLTLLALRRDRRELAWLLALPLLFLLASTSLKTPPSQEAVSVQPNIAGDFRWDQDEKDRAVRQLSLMTLERALDPRRQKPSLLLWPEAPAPFYYYDDPDFRAHVSQTARLASAAFVMGTVAYTEKKAPLNSAVAIGPRGELAGRYDKTNLVPFGEFIPPGFGWIEKISSEAGNYARGPGPKVVHTGGRAIGVFICYESAFPDFVRRFALDGAEVFVNLTNDGYFGRSAARAQHLLLARMRAVENARWLLRSSNDGITASIDPGGRVWDQLPELDRRAGRLRFSWERQRTPYTRFGDWFAWLCLAGGILAAIATEFPKWQKAP